MVGYNPNIDTSFMTQNLWSGVMIGFILQTIILLVKCQPSMAMVIFSAFLLLFTMWIYIVITMFICAIMGWDY
jgi:hypothetical protein